MKFFSGQILGILLIVQSSTYLDKWGGKRVYNHQPILIDAHPLVSQLLTLGNHKIYHQYLYFWVLQNFISLKEPVADIDKILLTINKIIDRKPKIKDLYLSTCFILAFQYRRPEYCQNILSSGLSVFPKNWSLLVAKGYILAFEFQRYQSAAKYYQIAATQKDAPPFLAKVADQFSKKKNLKAIQKNSLSIIKKKFLKER